MVFYHNMSWFQGDDQNALTLAKIQAEVMSDCFDRIIATCNKKCVCLCVCACVCVCLSFCVSVSVFPPHMPGALTNSHSH